MGLVWSDDYYRWDKTFSRQTGTQGEFCLVIGGKNIGKTFGLRLQCLYDHFTKGYLFCEICRTKTERDEIEGGYFDKLQEKGFYKDYDFKVEKHCMYADHGTDDEHDWRLVGYFVALSCFQQEKKRTYKKPYRYIFDEAIIDTKDRYHRYLKDEFLILGNLLDTISRQQPNEDWNYRVYMLGNACDMTCPYLRYMGIDRIPEYGYHWYNGKHTLLHYVEPWDAEIRKQQTFVGRMLSGTDEGSMIFDNVFADTTGGEISKKTSNARFAYALVYNSNRFAIWIDYKRGLFFVNSHIPKGSEKSTYVLTKKDGRIDYNKVARADDLMKILIKTYYAGGLRYSDPFIRESFHALLGYLGIS